MVTGAAASDMHIEVYTQDNVLVCVLSDNNALLGSYPVDPGMRLHVSDVTYKIGMWQAAEYKFFRQKNSKLLNEY